MNHHAKFEIVYEESTLAHITIRDLCGARSITNDAEAVVRVLHRAGLLTCEAPLRPGPRGLYYYETTGQLDEILHDGKGRFLGFKPGPRSTGSLTSQDQLDGT
jgi:hypothetical protein